MTIRAFGGACEAVWRDAADAIATLEAVAFGYGRKAAVSDVTVAFAAASATAVMGLNGSGKSTLLKGLAGELVPLHGRLRRPGRRQIAYLPQRTPFDANFPITVGGVLDLALPAGHGMTRRAARRRIEAALDDVELTEAVDRPVGALSGGQLQRVLFARIILQDAQLILLDEPFNGIDAQTTEDLLQLLVRWRREGRAVVAVLHDIDQARQAFGRTLLLAGSPLAWGPTELILPRGEGLSSCLRLAERHPGLRS